MTRRLLLLIESKSVWGETRKKVIRNILQRYCADYLPPNRLADSKVRIPRYLLNDLVRFWRTMAVDFGTKRWRTTKDESYLRLAKLRVTRKVLFAGPLATLLMVTERITSNEQLSEYLSEWIEKPPLAQLASMHAALCDKSNVALSGILQCYDEFIGLVGDEQNRKILEKRAENPSRLNELKIECKRIGDCIHEYLVEIFWNDELLKENFQKYGVF